MPVLRHIHPQNQASRLRGGAFTLVELLTVVAIITLIAAISIPAMSSILNSYNLDSIGQAVLGQLNYARQSALTSNKAVQIRFYQITDSNYNSTTPVYRAVQVFREDTDASGNTIYTPLAKPYFFPTPFALSTDTTASSLLGTSTSGATKNSTGDPTNPLPPPYGISPYIFFRFRPSGLTDLSAGTPNLTIYSVTAKVIDATHNLPANFITLQVDSVNGTARIYQP